MLAQAEQQAARRGAKNIQWLPLAAEDISAWLGRFHLVTLGSSFAWMNQALVLDRAYDLLEPGGGVAIIGNPGGIWEPSAAAYEQAVRAVVQRYLGTERRTLRGTCNFTEHAEKLALAQSRFEDVEFREWVWERTVDVATIFGELYSTSNANKSLLGSRSTAFEADVRAALLALNPAGPFIQRLRTECLLGHKR